MDFLTKDDLQIIIQSSELETLTGGDDTLLVLAENIAIEEMKSYLNGKFDTDEIFKTDNKQAIIILYLTDIMLYHLFSRIMPKNIPELRMERYDYAKTWLQNVADGTLSPNLPKLSEGDSNKPKYGNSNPKINHYY